MVLIIRKIIYWLLVLGVISGTAYAEETPAVSARSAVLMADGGEILFSKNENEKLPIASTTKIMTAIVVLENCGLEDKVIIQPDSCNIEGSSMYLKAGEEYSVRQLLQGLMLVSGNDAAHALALHTAGSIDAFAALMNAKAKSLGLDRTNFKNPHGLNEAEHYSSAEDMARLMAFCMQNSEFAKLTALKSMKLGEHSFINHNKLLYIYPGCIGGKTGYTMASGRCLVSVGEREGSRYICVTLSAPNDWNDHMSLYDWAFSNYSQRHISENLRFDVPVISGKADSAVLLAEDTCVLLPKKEEIIIKAELPRFVFAPVQKGECGGSFKAFCGGECVAEGRLLYQDDVEVFKE